MVKKMFRNSSKKVIVFTLVLLVVFAALAVMFPDSGDDWAWGSQLGIDRLKNKFDNYNGRWAGNLLVMLLTRCKPLDVIFTAVMLVCVCYLPKLFSRTESFVPYAFGTFLLLLIPKQIMVQSVVWTAGLTNYVPPIVLTFIYFILVKNIFESDAPVYHWIVGAVSAVIGFVSALFMENVTLYNIAMSILIIGFAFIKYKRVYITHIAHLAGSVGGAVLMFSNSVYRSIAAGTDSYRSTADDATLMDTIKEHTNVIFQQFFQYNFAVIVTLSILCVIVYIAFARKNESKWKKNAAMVSVFVNLISCFLIFAKKNFSYWVFFVGHEKSEDITTYAFAAIAILYCFSVLAVVLICVTDYEYKFKILLLLASVPVLIAPLLIVNPIGPRCFFPPYFMFIAACVVLFAYIEKEIGFAIEIRKGIAGSMLAGSLAVLIFLFNIYGTIHAYDVKRNEYVQKQIDAGYETVVMCNLPYASYVWMPNPTSKLWSGRYKGFHKIDDKIQFKFVNYGKYDEWVAKFDKEINE